MFNVLCQAWFPDQGRQKGFLPLLHVARNVIALQTVGWLVPCVVEVMVLSGESTSYFAAIVYAEINITEDDGSADTVVSLGHSTEGSNILQFAVLDDREE